jgi:hypothetical protein
MYGEPFIRRGVAGGAGNDPDLMALRHLAVGKIQDVAKQAADRRAHHVENPERSGIGHGLKPALADGDGVAGVLPGLGDQHDERAGHATNPGPVTAMVKPH